MRFFIEILIFLTILVSLNKSVNIYGTNFSSLEDSVEEDQSDLYKNNDIQSYGPGNSCTHTET